MASITFTNLTSEQLRDLLQFSKQKKIRHNLKEYDADWSYRDDFRGLVEREIRRNDVLDPSWKDALELYLLIAKRSMDDEDCLEDTLIPKAKEMLRHMEQCSVNETWIKLKRKRK